MAISYLTASLVLQPIFIHITARAVGRSVWDVVRAISGLLQAGLAMVVVTFAARVLLLHAGVPILVRLVLLVAVGAAVYLPCVLWRAPEVKEEIRRVLAGRGSGDAQSTQATPVDVPPPFDPPPAPVRLLPVIGNAEAETGSGRART